MLLNFQGRKCYQSCAAAAFTRLCTFQPVWSVLGSSGYGMQLWLCGSGGIVTTELCCSGLHPLMHFSTSVVSPGKLWYYLTHQIHNVKDTELWNRESGLTTTAPCNKVE